MRRSLKGIKFEKTPKGSQEFYLSSPQKRDFAFRNWIQYFKHMNLQWRNFFKKKLILVSQWICLIRKKFSEILLVFGKSEQDFTKDVFPDSRFLKIFAGKKPKSKRGISSIRTEDGELVKYDIFHCCRQCSSWNSKLVFVVGSVTNNTRLHWWFRSLIKKKETNFFF